MLFAIITGTNQFCQEFFILIFTVSKMLLLYLEFNPYQKTRLGQKAFYL